MCDRQRYRAARQEAKLSMKEDHLHNRAVNQALHGNVGKAMHLEHKAQVTHARAEAAGRRADAHSQHHYPGPKRSNVTVIHHHHHTTTPVPPPPSYPTGVALPPPASQFPPPPAYSPHPPGYPTSPPAGYPSPAPPAGYPAPPPSAGYPAPAPQAGYPAQSGYPGSTSGYPGGAKGVYGNPYQ